MRLLMTVLGTVVIALVFALACGQDSDDSSKTRPIPPPGEEADDDKKNENDNNEGASLTCLDKSFGTGVPAWISDNFTCVQVTKSGTNYVFKTNDVPNHNSAYFGTDDKRYEAVPTGNKANPNSIEEQNYVMTVPASPAKAGTATDTAMDAIGVAVNGVVFFNNEAAPGDSLTAEMETFDSYAGHPDKNGKYHYHTEPTYLTNDDDKLIGILLDGFPVFGRKCPSTGTYPSDLDDNNGHTADTKISGLGTIYHYHVADITGANDDGVSAPVITGSYAGTPGSFTNN